MGNDVKIGVKADFDGSSVDAGVSSIANKVNQANKTQYNPISDKAVKNAEALNKSFQQLIRIDADLKHRAKATGQSGSSYENFNWESAYPSAAQRAKKQQSAQAYVSNLGNFGSGGGSGPARAGFATSAVASAAQAGLRATGPAGGVVAGALGTGMSAGFGAGAMGLLGGMLALGVGKLVGAAMEKVTQAENNSVAMDALKRSLGDVNISFAALKSVVNSGADNLKITYEEAGRLTSQFVKLGNVSGDQYKSLAGELDVGVGMSRAFGLDPSQGMGVMGQMRGVGVTSNTQDSRKFALLIGETIGKADAFAKSGEVMEAISGFATSQTRNNLGAANSEGYAGMLSAMVGSKTPGMDVAGSTSMLAKIGASLSAGGAHGEASQFFTGMVGRRMGLDPVQTQILREGGAFASNDSMFGKGSAANKFGISGPQGNKTLLQGSLEMLREKYGHNKGLLAQATSNHLGIGINQAMGILQIKPNEMGEMQKYADLGKLSGSGIGNLSKSLYGSDADRKGLATSLLGRKDVSSSDKTELQRIMNSGSASEQKEILAKLTAQYDQERTTGSDIRDSKALLDNIKTSLATDLIPLTQGVRDGVLHLAGGGTKSKNEVLKDMLNLESNDRQSSIHGDFEARRKSALDEPETIRRQRDTVLADLKKNQSTMTPEQLKATQSNISGLSDQYASKTEEVRRRILKLREEEADAIGAEIKDRDGKISAFRSLNTTPGTIPGSSGSTDGAMKFFMGKGWTEAQSAGIAANLQAESGMNGGAVGDGGKAFGVAQWHPDRQANFKKWAGKDIRQSTLEEQYGFVHYEMTEGAEQAAGKKLKQSTTKGGAASAVSRYYERPQMTELEALKRANIAESIGTPLPTDVGAGGGRGSADSYKGLMLQAEPIVVEHRNERGEQVRPSQKISVNVRQASPFGSERFS
jgi:hypothetical protein